MALQMTTVVWDGFKANDRAGELECIGRLEDCAVDLKQWIDQNRLRDEQ